MLYVGVTNNLVRRIYEHKTNQVDSFTKEMGIHRLVYFEETNDVNEALAREKRLKKWRRDWKIKLIEDNNVDWNDLYESICEG